jgi:hypothetical protein
LALTSEVTPSTLTFLLTSWRPPAFAFYAGVLDFAVRSAGISPALALEFVAAGSVSSNPAASALDGGAELVGALLAAPAFDIAF